MGTCFVIQPFDKGPYDKRYEDIFAPAITIVGLEPYRVDRDPSASIPIDHIESGIRNSDICLADITTDNPNVWFELGYAIASQKEVVMVCGEERRAKFPFDIQHRNIINYSTDSLRDFEALKDKITKRIKAILAKEVRLGAVANLNPISAVEGLQQYEVAVLVAIAQNLDNPNEAVSTYRIKQDMEKAGFTRIASALGLTSLLKKQIIESRGAYDDQSREEYTVYSVTEKGMQWLFSNQDQLVLRKDNDIPF